MNGIDKLFDINMVLISLFSSLETIRNEKKIELVYEIDATIPKELKGNVAVLSELLTQILTFVFENTQKKEISLSLTAPKDFLYEESISFEIKETGLSKEMLVSFLESRLSKMLEPLESEIVYENEHPSDIHINIPFKINELGNRRHYRLPNMSMLGKKVLLLCRSKKVAQSMKRMFIYFLYDVTVGADEYKKQGSDLSQYDILIIDDELATEGIQTLIAKVQKNAPLKYVLLQDSHVQKNEKMASAYLIKPVMQQSIFELIILLFGSEDRDKSTLRREKHNIISMEHYIDEALENEDNNVTQNSKETSENKINQNNVKENKSSVINEEKKEINVSVLNTKLGEENTKKVGLEYSKELSKFVESFDRSDVYFRQVVNEKQTWQIKEFCIDLEKQSKVIGAQRMCDFADSVSLLFVYDKLDALPIYTGKYHVELKNLITEIKMYLSSLSK